MEGMIQNPGGAGLTASAPASFASLRSSAFSRLPANSARTHCCDFSPVEQAIKKTLHMEGFFNGAPGGVRTHNLLIRSQMLYPIELRVHLFFKQQSFNSAIHFFLQVLFLLI